jgi:hypothetical protein
MNKLESKLINKCRKLRMQGYSFGEISSIVGFAKSSLHTHLKDILLDNKQIKNIESRRKEKCRNKPNTRKGKCLPGREIIIPQQWSVDLVHIIAHFMFDGRVDNECCIYYSKDKYQIEHMNRLLYEQFKIKPKIQLRDNGVYGLVCYHVELANYISNHKEKLFGYLDNGASKTSKREFLRAFFDDEGNVFYKGDKRRVRGYQKSDLILNQIKNLLSEFSIKSKIDKYARGIEISGQRNLKVFSKEINFSPKIYINPNRRNGIWKQKISKRDILNLALMSYRK